MTLQSQPADAPERHRFRSGGSRRPSGPVPPDAARTGRPRAVVCAKWIVIPCQTREHHDADGLLPRMWPCSRRRPGRRRCAERRAPRAQWRWCCRVFRSVVGSTAVTAASKAPGTDRARCLRPRQRVASRRPGRFTSPPRLRRCRDSCGAHRVPPPSAPSPTATSASCRSTSSCTSTSMRSEAAATRAPSVISLGR